MVLETQTFLDNYIFSSGSSEESSSGSEESSDEEERRPSAGAGGSRRDEQERRRAPGGRERYTSHKITINNLSPLNTKFTISNSGRGQGGRRRSQRRGEAEGRRGEDLPDMKEVGGRRRRNPQRIRRKQQS